MSKSILGLIMGIVVALGLSLAPDAEAKRFGGGKSFGSKQSYSQNYSPSRANNNRPDQAQGASQAQPAGAAAAAGAAKKGMLGGMLGGLLMGGLLGALFFGGAFDNINFMDILIIAIVGFVLFKLFAMRRKHTGGPTPATAGAPYSREAAPDYQAPQNYQAPQSNNSGRGFDTDIFSEDKRNATVETVAAEVASGQRPTPGIIPAGFDRAGFLDGAKNAFARMQHAWDQGDLADIRQFSTDKVFAEVQDQHIARSADNRTEILNLDAELLQVIEVSGYHEAAVYFEAELREGDTSMQGEIPATTSREVWHFVRPINSRTPTWLLDGIQQLD